MNGSAISLPTAGILGVVKLRDRLQWILDHREISASALSVQAGQSRAYVRKLMEREPIRPDFNALERIAEVAKVPALWLIRGEGEPGNSGVETRLRLERSEEHIPAEDETPLDAAFLVAMDPARHTMRDLDAARAVGRGAPRREIPDGDLVATARQILDAARQLRLEGSEVTVTNVLWRVATGRHARGAEQLAELAAADDAETDASMRAKGFEPGQGREAAQARRAAHLAKLAKRGD